MKLDWHGIGLELLPDRALWRPDTRTLFVADVHFGKGETFRRFGLPVPIDTSLADCRRLSRLVHDRHTRRLVILGDLFHAAAGMTGSLLETLAEWRRELGEVDVDLVLGNHDTHAVRLWKERRIALHDEPWRLDDLDCRHHSADAGELHLCGHLHPGIAVRGLGRRPCFHITPRRLMLPAFGEFTGLATIEPAPADLVVAVTDGELVPVPAALRRRSPRR
jgi:DNA ligase-associated metallophosphoesterase